MIGWKRIVITVGEKIGKAHLTYGQGACAELVAMGTIGAADVFGLPVSTTQVLSSGVAGTMAANRAGLQWGTVRSTDGMGTDLAGLDCPFGSAVLAPSADHRLAGQPSHRHPITIRLYSDRIRIIAPS